ncbi:MAG: hypothetical protein AAFO97_03250 [Pseudomonadota bacterium]
MSRNNNPVIVAGSSIGQVSAETDDEFLVECFVDHPVLEEISNPDSPKMIVLGNTGVGKTAMLRMVERKKEKCMRIEIDELSLNYVSNSDVIKFLHAIDVPTDRFFQALWKHIVCLEYIKLRYRVSNEDKSRSFFDRLREHFIADGAKQKALKYLERWDNKFWVNFDESAAEVTKQLENDISGSVGVELEKFKADAGYTKKISETKKQHLQQRLKKFVDADLLSELAGVINLLAEYNENENNCQYVLIDRLDENWVDANLRFRLIRSLIEALKSMRRIRDLKVIVALRADLMEKVILETKEEGFQSEKYSDYVARLTWSHDQLKTVVNKRINFLFRRKYTKENVFFEDIFPDKISKEKPFPYVLDRTLHRPRDAISFVNYCLGQAAGKTVVNQTAAVSATRLYSAGRLEALVDEWRSVFPAIEPSIGVLRGRVQSFPLSELHTSDTVNQLMNDLFDRPQYQLDPLFGILDKSMNLGDGDGIFKVLRELIQRLHLIGAIGVNVAPSEPIHWFYKTQHRVPVATISLASKIRVHPMLHSALAIR